MAIGLLGAAGITAGVGGLFSLGSTIAGLVGSKKQNDLAQAEVDRRREENAQWYNRKMNEDYMMRTDVQNALKKQRELLQEQYQRARATNIVAGGTDESLALQQAQANKTLGDTMSDIAANASAYKDNIEQQYRAQENSLSQQQQQIYSGRAQQIADAASQAAQIGGKVAQAGLSGVVEARFKQKK